MKEAITFNGKPITENPLWPKDFKPPIFHDDKMTEAEFKRLYEGVWVNGEQAEDEATD